MKNIRRKLAAAVGVVALAGTGVVLGSGSASATPVGYFCTGLTTDGTPAASAAGYEVVNILTGQKKYYSSAQLLTRLAALVPNFPTTLYLAAEFTNNTPTSVDAGSTIAGNFDITVELPADLVNAAKQTLGLSAVTVTNAAFAVNASNAAPGAITGGFATRTIPLSPTPVVVSQNLQTALTPSGSTVSYQPGNAALTVQLNKTILALTIRRISLTCTPVVVPLGSTSVNGGSSTTTTSTSTTTTTEPSTTTSTSTSTTSTSTSTSTTSTSTSTSTTSTSTSTTSTSTTSIPLPTDDSVQVTMSGYSHGGTVSGTGFTILRRANGTISRVSGSGQLPGKNGGTATVSVNVYPVGSWWFGTIKVRDASAQTSANGYVLFASRPQLSGNTATINSLGLRSGSLSTFGLKIAVTDGDLAS